MLKLSFLMIWNEALVSFKSATFPSNWKNTYVHNRNGMFLDHCVNWLLNLRDPKTNFSDCFSVFQAKSDFLPCVRMTFKILFIQICFKYFSIFSVPYMEKWKKSIFQISFWGHRLRNHSLLGGLRNLRGPLFFRTTG